MLTVAKISLILALGVSLPWSVQARPTADWRFEEGRGVVILDSKSSDGADNGIAVNHPAFVDDAMPGGTGHRSLLFDGVDDAVVVRDNGNMRPASQLTIEAIIKPEDGARAIVGKPVGRLTANSWQLEWGGGPIGVSFGDDTCFTLTDTLLKQTKVCAKEPTVGAWHHVAGTWDGATMRLYVDYLLVSTAHFARPIKYDNNPVLIGAENDGGGIPDNCGGTSESCQFKGEIDRVRLSNTAIRAVDFIH